MMILVGYLALELLVVFLCCISLATAVGREDPLEVLCLVQANWFDPKWPQPTYFEREPLFDMTYIPASKWLGFNPSGFSTNQGRRYIRRYFPRSYQELTGSYEFLLLYGRELVFSLFTHEQLGWMKKAIEEDGMGGLQGLSVISQQRQYAEQWAGISLSDTFPNDADAVVLACEGPYFEFLWSEIEISEAATLPKVFTSYRDDSGRWLLDLRMGYGPRMIARDGAQVYAWFLHGDSPYVLGWRYGEGYTWSLAQVGMGGMFGKPVHKGTSYVYGYDAFFGMLYHSTGRHLPEDVVMVHQLRESFGEYSDAMSSIYSLMEFVEGFGVNTNPLFLRADVLRKKWKEGRDLYLAQEWERSKTVFDRLVEDVSTFTEEAIEFKNRALFWVYVSEWSVVTGTLLFSGFVVWMLMIKKRLYSEVKHSRLVAT
jgi:hypothetical protein